ncbi:hypothetical protein PRVXH_002550 [Proteinivorax hydrogeniformans]|uniref:Uncharacterized protein n=1 Tax=Proteinivorax hydrogeniformans TaxID=1826727 RepID=A0AAU8HSN3_9FIRM
MVETILTALFLALGFCIGVWVSVDILKGLVNFIYAQWGENE